MIVRVNGRTVLSRLVRSRTWNVERLRLRRPVAVRAVSLTYGGDYAVGGCDRNLRVDTIALGRG